MNSKKKGKKLFRIASSFVAGISFISLGTNKVNGDASSSQRIKEKTIIHKIQSPNLDPVIIPIESSENQESKISDWFLFKNPFFKTVIVFPVWLVFKILSYIISAGSVVFSPLIKYILLAAFNTVLIGALFISLLKILFPDKKITDLIKGKEFLYFIIGGFLIAIVESILERTIESSWIPKLISLIFSFFILLYIMFKLLPKQIPSRQKGKYIIIP